jgi:TonB-linked SusC/RagA family outer membrane protein
MDQSYSYDKVNYRANLDFALTKSTALIFNVGGDFSVQNQPKSTPWRQLYQTSPAKFPAYFPAWVLEEVPDLDYPDETGERLSSQLDEFTGNPYGVMNQGDFNQYTDSKLFSDLILDQKLDFITKGLSVKGKVALSTYYKMRTLYSDFSLPKYRLDYDKIGAIGTNGKPINPWFREGQTDQLYMLPPVDLNVGALEGGYYSDLYYEAAINYSRTFGKHSVTGLALFNRQQKNAGTDFAYFNEAWVGRTIYNYSQKYLLEINVGYTGSERFGPANRFGFFPSGAIGWIVSEEAFFKRALPWMSKLKLRYSDGLVGSDSSGERWLYQSSYFTDNAGKIREDLGANSTSQWESARKKDLGIEIGFLKNELTFSVDFFDEKREKMLLTPRTVTFLVGNGFKSLNLGKIKKHGIEVEAEYNKKVNTNFQYNLRGVFGYNDNRVVFKDDLPYSPDYKKDAGKPLGSQNGGTLLAGDGYYTSIDDIMNNPSPIPYSGLNVGDYKFLDFSADGAINNLDQMPIKGNLYPPITYSLGGGFSFRDFEFSLLFQGNAGKYVDFNQSYENEFTKGTWRIHESALDYWTPTNQDANHSTLHYVGAGDALLLKWGGGEADRGYGIKVQDRFWRNADYLRIKEIYMGYTINAPKLEKLAGISNFMVYASANNVYTFTNLIEGDPERKDFQQGFYPQMMTLKLGLKLAF